MSLREISPRAAYLLVAVGFVAFLLIGWFTLISPQRDEAAQLQQEIEATQILLAAPVPEPEDIVDPEEASEQLKKAMPDAVEMPGVILDLHRLAGEAGVRLDSITPGGATAQATYQAMPISVTLQGSFFAFSDFLRRLRAETQVVDGKLEGDGRIYGVDSITFAEGRPQFPNLTATLVVSTVFGPVAPAPPAVPQEGTGALPEAPAAETP